MLDAEATARRYEELAKKEYVTQQQARALAPRPWR